MELPEEFLKNMKRLLGEEEYARWLESFLTQPKNGLRRNKKKTSAKEFESQMPFSLKKSPG